MKKYDTLPKEIAEQIELDRKMGKINPYAMRDDCAIRRNSERHDKATVLRSNFIRDIDKILNCPFYNRYADKTQVYSFYKNEQGVLSYKIQFCRNVFYFNFRDFLLVQFYAVKDFRKQHTAPPLIFII